MDQGQHSRLCWNHGSPTHFELGDIQPARVRKAARSCTALAAQYSSAGGQALQALQYGQIGQIDLHILTELFGGEKADRDLTPAWDGGLYWAGQRLNTTTSAEQASTNSIALFYLSAWKNPASAQAFARLYANELAIKYSGVHLDMMGQGAAPANRSNSPLETISQEQVYSTSEGPVVITHPGQAGFRFREFSA